MNGIRLMAPIRGVDPFVVPGDASSGTSPGGILPPPSGESGQGDRRTQAYNFRLTLTDVKENQVPITKPEPYDPALLRVAGPPPLAASRPVLVDRVLLRLTPMP